jgi:hypothetical protein
MQLCCSLIRHVPVVGDDFQALAVRLVDHLLSDVAACRNKRSPIVSVLIEEPFTIGTCRHGTGPPRIFLPSLKVTAESTDTEVLKPGSSTRPLRLVKPPLDSQTRMTLNAILLVPRRKFEWG